MKLILATKNEHKVNEFARILNPIGYEVISQSAAEITTDVCENADSFEGNAMLKARAIYDKCKIPTIADDSGLCVDALGGEPGIYSARYGGDACSNDKERYELLLHKLENVAPENRTARFVCSIAFIDENGDSFTFTGTCEGSIGYKALGENGFGYDPIFIVDGTKSFSQLAAFEKDEISHRGNAIKKLRDMLEKR